MDNGKLKYAHKPAPGIILTGKVWFYYVNNLMTVMQPCHVSNFLADMTLKEQLLCAVIYIQNEKTEIFSTLCYSHQCL